MVIFVYSKDGDMSTARGLVLSSVSYNDTFFKKPPIYGEEISEEEYDDLMEFFKTSGVKRGLEGYVNDEGYEKYLQRIEELRG